MAEASPRSRWTDERLDDLARRVDAHDAQLHEITPLPAVVDGVGVQLGAFRAEIRAAFADVRSELRELRADAAVSRRWMIGLWATAMLGIAGLLVELALS